MPRRRHARSYRRPSRPSTRPCARLLSAQRCRRSGLMLFLRRGMWGWAQTLTATAITPREQNYPSSIAWPLHRGHSAVVHVLATIRHEHQRSEITMNVHLKVQPHHLERSAYRYIRQSSMRQVIDNTESHLGTKIHYIVCLASSLEVEAWQMRLADQRPHWF